MWDQTLRDWASTSLSESQPTDGHTRSRGACLHPRTFEDEARESDRIVPDGSVNGVSLWRRSLLPSPIHLPPLTKRLVWTAEERVSRSGDRRGCLDDEVSAAGSCAKMHAQPDDSYRGDTNGANSGLWQVQPRGMGGSQR